MITVKNISKLYKSTLAVDNVSFGLNEGEIVAFLGSNGAGKSSTMKIVSGVIQPDKGEVYICGYNIENDPVEAKKKLGYLSEDNPLPVEMYVREYLEYVAGMYKITNRIIAVEQSIERFGLNSEYRKKIGNLSKGNRQKLGLAQAMMHNPDFLILDEPTSALDPNQQAEIKEMIKSVAKSKTILFSTHILPDVKDLASRVIIIDKGAVQIDKSIHDIDSVENLFYKITNENSSR